MIVIKPPATPSTKLVLDLVIKLTGGFYKQGIRRDWFLYF